jgi:hypothetical protein
MITRRYYYVSMTLRVVAGPVSSLQRMATLVPKCCYYETLTDWRKTVLVPQPSADPNDPMNWSWFKKHMMLFIVALSAFCGDFGSGAGIPCIVPQ